MISVSRLAALGCAVMAALAIGAHESAASGATAAQAPTQVLWSGDAFYNYDFASQSVSQSNVDWPLTVFFTNNANINKVKCNMDNSDVCGDWAPLDGASFVKYNFRLNDGPTLGWEWDQDGGKKTTSCPAWGDSANHYRMYASNYADRNYNSTLGYYTMATTHRDWSECPPGGSVHYDYTEGTENKMTAWASDNTAVANDKFWMYNPEPYRVQGNHTWDSNGYASTIHVP